MLELKQWWDSVLQSFDFQVKRQRSIRDLFRRTLLVYVRKGNWNRVSYALLVA